MAIGTIKWFTVQKGYGFITEDGPDGKDFFLHYENIEMDGFKTLDTGDRVEFEKESTHKGWMAVHVRRIGATAPHGH